MSPPPTQSARSGSPSPHLPQRFESHSHANDSTSAATTPGALSGPAFTRHDAIPARLQTHESSSQSTAVSTDSQPYVKELTKVQGVANINILRTAEYDRESGVEYPIGITKQRDISPARSNTFHSAVHNMNSIEENGAPPESESHIGIQPNRVMYLLLSKEPYQVAVAPSKSIANYDANLLSLIQDILVAIGLVRLSILVSLQSAVVITGTSISNFLVVALPFLATYYIISIESESALSNIGTFNNMYSYIKIAGFAYLAWIAPGIFVSFEGTGALFAIGLIILRVFHCIRMLMAFISSYFSMNIRLAFYLARLFAYLLLIVPCMFLAVAYGKETINQRLKQCLIATTVIDQVVFVGSLIVESYFISVSSRTSPYLRKVAAETRCNEWSRMSRVVTLSIFVAAVNMFNTISGVSWPDKYVATQVSNLSFVMFLCGIIVLVAMERFRVRMHAKDSLLTMGTYSGSLFMWLHFFLAIAVQFVTTSLTIVLKQLYASHNSMPTYQYAPPANAPTITALNVMNYSSSDWKYAGLSFSSDFSKSYFGSSSSVPQFGTTGIALVVFIGISAMMSLLLRKKNLKVTGIGHIATVVVLCVAVFSALIANFVSNKTIAIVVVAIIMCIGDILVGSLLEPACARLASRFVIKQQIKQLTSTAVVDS